MQYRPPSSQHGPVNVTLISSAAFLSVYLLFSMERHAFHTPQSVTRTNRCRGTICDCPRRDRILS